MGVWKVMYVDALFPTQTRIHQTMNKKFFERYLFLCYNNPFRMIQMDRGKSRLRLLSFLLLFLMEWNDPEVFK